MGQKRAAVMLDAGMKTFATINVRKYDLRLQFDTSNLHALDAALAPSERAGWSLVWRRPPPGAATVAAAGGGLACGGDPLAAAAVSEPAGGPAVGPRGSGSSSSLTESVVSQETGPSSASVDGAVQIDSGASSPVSCSTPRKGSAVAALGGAAGATAADADAGAGPSPERDTKPARDAAAKAAAAALRAAGGKAAAAAAPAGVRYMSWQEFQCNTMAFL
jgi:hypothetical protein